MNRHTIFTLLYFLSALIFCAFLLALWITFDNDREESTILGVSDPIIAQDPQIIVTQEAQEKEIRFDTGLIKLFPKTIAVIDTHQKTIIIIAGSALFENYIIEPMQQVEWNGVDRYELSTVSSENTHRLMQFAAYALWEHSTFPVTLLPLAPKIK